MSKPEQAERNWMRGKISEYHRYLKRAGRRLMRRLGKRDLDDAPKKLPRRGWEY